MSIQTETSEIIKENLNLPKSAEIDGEKVEQFNLNDQIAAAKFLAAAESVKQKHSGLKFQKLSHSGAV